jgi:hypothetical protein
MPTADLIHDTVKTALIKNGWTITADPYVIQYGDVNLFADLAAERTFSAEREGRKIVVEVKSFASPSPMHDLEVALGQYEVYRAFLELTAPDRELYLAVSDIVYSDFFERNAIQVIVQRFQLSLLVVDLEKQEIVEWTN